MRRPAMSYRLFPVDAPLRFITTSLTHALSIAENGDRAP